MATAPAHYADRPFFGVAEAIVVSAIDPEGESRVKVKLPWLSTSQETEWCRTANVFAGNGYGSTWTPEVDDEVLVAFVHGDLRYPVVLGGLYNGKDKPPAKRDKTTNRKVFRTKVGHQLVLDDSEGSLKISLQTKNGHRLELDDTGSTVTLTTKGRHQVSIDDTTGKLTLSATTIEITATDSITMTAPKIALNP